MIKLANTDLTVYPLCLGGNVFGYSADKQNSEAVLSFYADNGGNFIDTAAVYGDGDSERDLGGLLGVLIPRDEVVIATKAGISFKTGERKVDNSRTSLISDLDKSLTRLVEIRDK